MRHADAHCQLKTFSSFLRMVSRMRAEGTTYLHNDQNSIRGKVLHLWKKLDLPPVDGSSTRRWIFHLQMENILGVIIHVLNYQDYHVECDNSQVDWSAIPCTGYLNP